MDPAIGDSADAQLLAFITQVQGGALQFIGQAAADALSREAGLLREAIR